MTSIDPAAWYRDELVKQTRQVVQEWDQAHAKAVDPGAFGYILARYIGAAKILLAGIDAPDTPVTDLLDAATGDTRR